MGDHGGETSRGDDLRVATLAQVPLQRALGIPLHVAHYTGGSFQPHYHSHLELIIVNSDSGYNVIAGERTAFRRRQVYQLGMFHPHRIEGPPGGHCDYFNVTFAPEVVAGPRTSVARERAQSAEQESAQSADPLLAPHYATDPARAFLLPESDYLRAVAICRSLLAEIDASDRYSASIVLGEFQALLALVARNRPHASGAVDGRVQRVLRVITERFDEPLETRELAGMVGVSPSRLAQLFRDCTGTTIRQALLRRRITEAKRLLATTDLPITSLLHACGFNDVSYFNRSFRSDTGRTPREYRQAAAVAKSSPGFSRSGPVADASDRVSLR